MPNNDYINDDKKRIKAYELFNKSFLASKKDYDDLVELGVKKEDARYVLPQAMNTSFLMSGTLKNINHFIVQRKDKHAQAEIRSLANCIEKVLN